MEELKPQSESRNKSKRAKARRVGQVIPKGSNKWLIRIFRGRDDSGKKKFHSEVVNGTKPEAEKFLRAKLVEIEAGTFIEPTSDAFHSGLGHGHAA